MPPAQSPRKGRVVASAHLKVPENLLELVPATVQPPYVLNFPTAEAVGAGDISNTRQSATPMANNRLFMRTAFIRRIGTSQVAAPTCPKPMTQLDADQSRYRTVRSSVIPKLGHVRP